MSELMTLAQVAAALKVSRRRVQAMIDAGQIRALRVGQSWLVSAVEVRRAAHLYDRGVGGRPISARAAWEQIAAGVTGLDMTALDRFRRRVRRRAEHTDVYVHPSVLAELRYDMSGVLGGRDAADAADLAAGAEGSVDLYLRRADLAAFTNVNHPVPGTDVTNLYLHIVDDNAWPFAPKVQFAPVLVAWLDLEDREDRAARLVLEHIQRTGKRVAAE